MAKMTMDETKCDVCHGTGAPISDLESDEECYACHGSGEALGEFGPGEYETHDAAPSSCEHCGAPEGMPCDPRCPAAEHSPPDPDWFREGADAGFDKFMNSIVLKEQRATMVNSKEVSPQRRLARNYQEHPLGKIKMGNR